MQIHLHPLLPRHRRHLVAALGGHDAATDAVKTLLDWLPPDKVDAGMGSVLYIVDLGMLPALQEKPCLHLLSS